MPRKKIRFGICSNGQRAATWKCIVTRGYVTTDLYLTCREMRGALKVSLHQSGYWHIELMKRGYIDKWARPKECEPGITAAFRIITPADGVITPMTASESKDIFWIRNAPSGMATEIAIVLTDRTATVSGWPGKQKLKTKLIDCILIDNGEAIWIVYRTIEVPKVTPDRISFKFDQDFSADDLKTGNSRILIIGKAGDGIRVFYDSPIIKDKVSYTHQFSLRPFSALKCNFDP